MKLAYFIKLLLFNALIILQCTVAQAADIVPVSLPADLPVSSTNPYVLDLDQAVITPNGNFLTQDHAMRFDMGVTTDATNTTFVRITLTEEIIWNGDNAVLLFEEGNQPNSATGTQDLNADGILQVLEVGSLIEITPPQNILIFSIDALSINANASLVLSTANPDYSVANGRITNTAAHPIISIIATSKPARVTYSVHNTNVDAQNGTNSLFTDPDILLVNFVQQFDFAITQAATSVLDSIANPPNSLFINEGNTQDVLSSNSDTDTTLSAANYLLVNNASLIEDQINLDSKDVFIVNVFGNMNTVSNVFIEFDDSGLTSVGTRSDLSLTPTVATVQFAGNTMPATTREDKIAIEISSAQSLQASNYSVNAQLLLSRADGLSDVIMDTVLNNTFSFLEQQTPIFSSQPILNSNIEMISEFATPTSAQITFMNEGMLPLDIQLVSQASGEFDFVNNYAIQLAAGQTDGFSVQCIPSSISGTQLGIQFTTNSPSQAFINYNLQCRTQAQPEPEIEITADGILIETGQNEINFGTIYQGESKVVKVTIRNIGSDTLTLDNPTIPTGFSLGFGQTIPKQLLSIAQDQQNYTASFDLILTGSLLGEFKPIFSLSNNDRDENPYLITLKGKVERKPDEPPVSDSNAPTEIPITPISGVTIGSNIIGVTNNSGNTATDINIQANGSISGGYLAGDITSQGLIANLTLNPDTTVEGGKISSVVYNFGTVCNATITRYSQLIGGNICNEIQNFGTLTDVNILDGALVSGGVLNNIIFSQGTLCDVELDDDTRLIGGQISCILTGQARAPATIAQAEILQNSQLSNVCITPSVTFAEGVELRGKIQLPKSFEYPDMPDYCIQPEQLSKYNTRDLLGIDPEALSIFLDADLQKIPADAMSILTPAQMSFIPETTLDSVSEAQFNAIPIQSFSGLTEHNMSGLTGYLIGYITPEHIGAMKETAINNLNAWGTTKYLTNFNPELVPLETAQIFLKPGWTMDENGLLTVPADTPINLASFKLPEAFPQQVSIDYDFPNFSKGFGVGGRGIPILNEMNQALNDVNNPQGIRSIQQREDGLVVMIDRDGLQRSFIPDVDGQIQLNVDAAAGVILDEETGKLLVTTTAQQLFSFIPAPKDYFLLGDTLGENNAARCYDKGDVLLEIQVDGRTTHVVVIFGADVNQDTGDTGVYLPDDNTPVARRNLRAPIREGRVVFSDGTSQNIYPAVLFPETFISLAKQIEGVENVVLNVDGTLGLNFFGLSYLLLPTFDTTTRRLDAGERIPPSLTSNPDSSVAYQVQDGDLLVTTQIIISLF
ncbi:hypothetical protein [Candidatus Albibeggiatoa sp. nov. BB20]|uniref:hypothetical protein n=1 Tax=Candidatus Albibeggiatoa sp. nov. BB20 TaxID=3162723 RepID=UPI003365ACB1